MKGAAIVLTCLAAVACRGRGRDRAGSGVEKVEVRRIDEFHKIRVGGAIHAEVMVGPHAQATLTGDDNLLGGIALQFDGDVLRVQSDPAAKPKLDLRVRLTTPKLDWIAAEGASVVRVEQLATSELQLFTGGAARLALQGVASELSIHSKMVSVVDARHLAAQLVHVDNQDAAQIFVGYSQRLDGRIAGAGRVVYQGKPDLATEVSPTGTLIGDR